MNGINWGRVVAGGLLAGLIMNIGEAISWAVFGPQMEAILDAHGLTFATTPGWMVLYLVLGFVFGIVAIWIYASIRPRYGAGPKSAIIAAVMTWILGYMLPMFGYLSLGLATVSLVMVSAVWGLAEIVIGTLAGAWLYRE
jgi:drug/metabolite transporter (DMT)-like permease